MTPRIAVIHHSRRGTVRALAAQAAEGARAAGAEVRLLRVDDDQPAGAQWAESVAGPEDVLWAEGLVLATPTYFGNVSSPFKRFLETTSPLWRKGLLADRLVAGMTASTCPHGGREATLLALHHTAYHWGSWVIGADPSDEVFQRAGLNPFGVSGGGGPTKGEPSPEERLAARALGRRLAGLTSRACPATPSAPVAGPVKVTVVHCADDAATALLAQQAAAGARSVGAKVRLRRVDGAAGPGTVWRPGPPPVPATPEDVAWADAVLFGGPARLGTLAPALIEFAQSLDTAWPAPSGSPAGPGPLSGKPASVFTSVEHTHAGSESALLAFHHLLFHSGAVVVPPGYTDPSVFEAGGNPYGTSHSLSAGAAPPPTALAAAAHQGRRVALAGDLLRRENVTESLGGTPDGDGPSAVRRDRGVLRGIQGAADGALSGTGEFSANGR